LRQSTGDHDAVLDHHVVHPDELRGPLRRIHLRLGDLPEPVVLLVAPAGDVPPGPLVVLAGDLGRREHAHAPEGIDPGASVVHLQVGVEVRIGVGVRRVGSEEDGGDDGLDLDLDARLGARLLDDLLRLLPRSVGRGLIEELQALGVFHADAVRAALPTAASRI